MNSLFEATSSKVALSFLVFVVILAACEMFHPATPLAKTRRELYSGEN